MKLLPCLLAGGDDRLSERLTVNDLVAVDLEAAEQRAERTLGTDRLQFRKLRGEGQTVSMTGVDDVFARRQTASRARRQQVGGVDREAINHTDAAIAQD